MLAYRGTNSLCCHFLHLLSSEIQVIHKVLNACSNLEHEPNDHVDLKALLSSILIPATITPTQGFPKRGKVKSS
jgi:hypothetical protein